MAPLGPGGRANAPGAAAIAAAAAPDFSILRLPASIASFSVCNRSALSLLNLRDEELFQIFVREPERRRLFQRLVSVPAIDDRTFHEPHPGGSSTASSMDERRLDARRGNRFQKRID